MKRYSIMNMNMDHVEEICLNIKDQYERDIADTVLFSMPLVPEGDPVWDKAADMCKKYDVFRDRLAEMGLECGILVQCSIGHGYPLNEMFPFQPCVNLNDGEAVARCCPYDEDLRDHFRDVMEVLASHKPATIMIDDDMRLLHHTGKGCACELHMAEFNKRAGTNINREQLYEIILDKNNKDCKRFREIFEQTQDDSLVGLAKAMREGMDRVDPSLGASICTVGNDPHGKMASVLAGKGNPSIIRVNNGAYTTPGARNFSAHMFDAALQMHLDCNKADIYLAETDTCPQNRYSTGAQYLHSHFVGTLLEGAVGAKHWITYLTEYEPESGEAYRNILSKNAGMYRALTETVPKLKWLGCNIPLPNEMPFAFELPPFEQPQSAWASKVLERLGLPLYFSTEISGAMFIDDGFDAYFDDDKIKEMFKGSVYLSAEAAKGLNKRGFTEMTGVEVREWTGKAQNKELICADGKFCRKQFKPQELVPINDKVEILSYMISSKLGVNEKLYPSVTCYKNQLGGTTFVFCGSPDAPFHYTTGFGFLTATRKRQMVDMLKRTGNLPVYYKGDAEVYLKAAQMEDGSLFCAVFNIGLDPLENIPLVCDKTISSAEMMDPDGTMSPVSFEYKPDHLVINAAAYTLNPVILKLK